MTLSHLEDSMTAREFYLWIGFDQINPIGDERADIQAAQVAAAIYQSKGAKVALQDIVLDWGKKTAEHETDSNLEDLFTQLAGK
ncbi:DUF4035 domain-containing protein [Orbus sturtevantii]|uniref:phage tail assembly protein T n=1 Tax=Orbus sturtevantii TaxID=3074109 RepID=UPI00370D7AEB